MKLEKRFITAELRAEQLAGKTYLVGRAASYGVMSHDLGGWREILSPGCFDDALAADDLDVVHTVDHQTDKVLGRTASGTLKLTSDGRGLNYKTLLPNTSYAADLAELCKRGDISQSSFAFVVDPAGQEWSDIDDPDNEGLRCSLRTITKIRSLHDVSTVCSGAYPETAAELASRSLPPGMPAELRNRLRVRAVDDDDFDDNCECGRAECLDGDCSECSNEDCEDPNCRGCQYATRGARGAGADNVEMKIVDGEALPQSAFLIHGDERDPETWKLPVRFNTLAKSEKHVRKAIQLFPTLKDIDEEEKERAWQELEALAKKYGIDVDTDDDRAARLRRLEIAMSE